MQQLNVTISRANGNLVLTPQTLNAFAGDQIFWVNNDGNSHQPVVVNPDGSTVPLVDPIKRHDTSSVFSPEDRVDANKNFTPYSINYILADSPATTGVIAVTEAP